MTIELTDDIQDEAVLDLIERAFPPGEERPHFDVPRFWSNRHLRDPDTIIALVLGRPSTEDLARTIVAYGPRRVLEVMRLLAERGEFNAHQLEQVVAWLRPIIRGVADAARELAAAKHQETP